MEACIPECLVPTVKHGGGSVMIWAAISSYSAGLVITMNGQITSSDYVDILRNQLQPIVQILFPKNDAVFQDNTSPIRPARSVQSWFYKHEYALQHLPWPAQSPDLNNVEPLCTVLESSLRSRFPPASSLKPPRRVVHYSTREYSELI